MPRLLGKRLAVAPRGNRVLRPGVPIVISHTINPCLRRNKGYLCSPSHPLTPALFPSSFRGAPLLVPMVWGILECLGNQGRLGLPTVGGVERTGCTRISDKGNRDRGDWWVGTGAGDQLGS